MKKGKNAVATSEAIKSREIKIVDIDSTIPSKLSKIIRKTIDDNHFVDIDGNIYSNKARAGKIVKVFKMKESLSCGYKKVSIAKKSHSVHRLVLMAFTKKPDENNYYEVNHIDGDKLNNKVSNLEWVTKSQNIKHAYDKGLAVTRKGESCNLTKLDDCQVLAIHTLRCSGVMVKKIAEIYGVTPYCISRITNGHNRRII